MVVDHGGWLTVPAISLFGPSHSNGFHSMEFPGIVELDVSASAPQVARKTWTPGNADLAMEGGSHDTEIAASTAAGLAEPFGEAFLHGSLTCFGGSEPTWGVHTCRCWDFTMAHIGRCPSLNGVNLVWLAELLCLGTYFSRPGLFKPFPVGVHIWKIDSNTIFTPGPL